MKRSALMVAMSICSSGLLWWGSSPSSAAELRGRSGSQAVQKREVNHTAAYQDEEALPEVTPTPSRATAPKAAPKPAARVPQRAAAPDQHYGWEGDDAPHEPSYQPGMYLDEDCDSGACGVLDNCKKHDWWGSAEYLLWYRRGRSIPPLVTTATAVVNQDVDAQIGSANTRILLGPDSFDDRIRPGGRFDFGMWFDPEHITGVGTRFTGLGNDSLHYTVNSTTNSVLAIPFNNLDRAVNGEDTLLIAHPTTGATGNINVDSRNSVYLGDVYLRKMMIRECEYHIDMIGGYFYSSIREDLNISSTTLVGNTVNVRDSFRTKNTYNGGSIGLLGEFDRSYFRVNLLAKVALTSVHETVAIAGSTTVDGVAQTPAAGLFAQTSNSGTFTRDRFSAVPEFGMNWAYKMGCGWELTSGYSLVYWDHSVRPGNQIDRSVDATQTAARPAFTFHDSAYWAHGMNIGVNWVY